MRLLSYASYQFWVFVVGGGLLALLHGRAWSPRPPSTAPFELAVELDAGYAHGHYNLGVAHQAAGRLEAALERYRAAGRADPRDHARCLNHATTARLLGHLDEAYAAARCAVARERDAASHDELGQVLLARGDPASAALALAEAIRLDSGRATTALDLGVAYAALGRTDDAERAWRAAVAARPDLAEAWLNLGILQRERGQPAEARASFAAAVRADPTQTRALGNLAALDAEAGDTEAALRWLDRLLALEPDHEGARALRARLSGPSGTTR